MSATLPIQKSSDKYFWHKYDSFYKQSLSSLDPCETFDIMEIGVLNSLSIKAWREKYPLATIIGCDIVSKDDWYIDEKIKYAQFDQSDFTKLEAHLNKLNNPRLLIDDGSHAPGDQLLFLLLSLRCVKNATKSHQCSKFIIIEDMHTCLTQIQRNKVTSKHKKQEYSDQTQIEFNDLAEIVNPLDLILCIDKTRRGSQTIGELHNQFEELKANTESMKLILEIIENCLSASNIKIFRRSILPDACWRCGNNIFKSQTLLCSHCGADGYKHDDSISVCIEFN